MAKQRTPAENAFLARYEIDERGCWIWVGERSGQSGYGTWVIRKIPLGNGKYKKERIYAHRLAWELYRGPIPEGIRVLHRCDVPLCVNPGHLFLGTPADNTHDMIAKKRHSRGEKRWNSRVTEADVQQIRNSTDSLKRLAVRYGICFQQISAIKRRENWKHIP